MSVTQADLNQIKTKFNALVTYVKTMQTNIENKFEAHKNSINGLVNVCSNLRDSVQNINTSSSNDANLKQTAQQLNALVDYLNNWIDTGNVTMNDIRTAVGEPLSFADA